MASIKGPTTITNSGKNNKQRDLEMEFVDDDWVITNRRFYFVKLQESRNPDLVEAEKLLDLRFVVSQAREEKLMQKNRLQSTLQNPSYYYVANWNRMRDGLKLLRLCMDDRIRLSVANNDIVSKEVKRSAFRTIHGSSSLAKERKIMKRMNEAQSNTTKSHANTNTSCEDYDQIMERLKYSLERTTHALCKQKEEILAEIQQLRCVKEEAWENAACRGEQPESSFGREDADKKIKDSIKLLEGSREGLLQYNDEFAATTKELRDVEEDLACLDKQLEEIDEVMCRDYRSLPQWRKQHQEEKECHDKNVSLLRNAGKLADKKEAATLGSLSEGQVEGFMGRWNEDAEFRHKYQKRECTSLNSRGLCADGRTRNSNQEPIAIDGPRIKLPNRIRKLLIKNRPIVPT